MIMNPTITRLCGIVPQPPKIFHQVITVVGNDTYIWCYKSGQESLIYSTAGRFAAHPELNMTWNDAQFLCASVRMTRKKELKPKKEN